MNHILSPNIHMYVFVSGGRNVGFSENLTYVLNEWSQSLATRKIRKFRHSEPYQPCKIQLFVTTVISAKSFILDVWESCEYASEFNFINSVLFIKPFSLKTYFEVKSKKKFYKMNFLDYLILQKVTTSESLFSVKMRRNVFEIYKFTWLEVNRGYVKRNTRCNL